MTVLPPLALLALAATVAAQQSSPLRPLPQLLPEVVLSDARDRVPVADYRLGDGGVNPKRGRSAIGADGGVCTTAGGVRVACLSAGVKLTFPSGRELLVSPDGFIHLRSGERAGPFSAGVELQLADGVAVRIALAQRRRQRVRDVWVVDGERSLQPWRRGRAAHDSGRVSRWAGIRFACCGDGGDLYRPIALGPLVVLDRILVADERAATMPAERLLLLSEPLRRSLAVMGRQHREPNADVRRAIRAVNAVADRGNTIFPAGAALQRAEHDRLRWLLRGGFELQLDLDGPQSPRLQLFAGTSPLPMVEWTLSLTSAAFLTNPRDDQIGKRWHGNGTRLTRVATELQAREHLFERRSALQVLQRMTR